MSYKKELESKLVVGAVIKIGEEFAEFSDGRFNAGEEITLIEGHFEYENGLYTEDRYCPAIWNSDLEEYDSIYHLFGNELNGFDDCEVIATK